jgi:TetR/AcrR family transcriptional regulator, regulator of autoinduction and epiphytic fitness
MREVALTESKKKLSRGRGPSALKTANTRTAILAAALEEFAERGYEQAPMASIAIRAGLAKGTLYLYFPTKLDLFEATLRDLVGGLVASLQTAIPAAGQSVQALVRAVVLPKLEIIQQPKRLALFRMIVTEGHRVPDLVNSYATIALNPALAAISSLAQIAYERGEIRSPVLAEHPLLFMAPVLAGTIWNGLFPDKEVNLTQLFEAFWEMIFIDR